MLDKVRKIHPFKTKDRKFQYIKSFLVKQLSIKLIAATGKIAAYIALEYY